MTVSLFNLYDRAFRWHPAPTLGPARTAPLRRPRCIGPSLTAVFGLALLLAACAHGPAKETTNISTALPPLDTNGLAPDRAAAKFIIREAVLRDGLPVLAEAAFEFRFRDRMYRYQRTGGAFAYERWWIDTATLDTMRDVLHNDGLVRFANGIEVELEEKKAAAFRASVNSVIYFAFLPWALLDPGVEARYIGRDTIKGRALDRVEVSFAAAPGHEGHDMHEDEYLYWFAPETHELAYMSYSHADGRAPRLREPFNEREVGGVTVRDYRNYHTPGNEPRSIKLLAGDFTADALPLLSTIELKGVRRVEISNDRLGAGIALGGL